MDLSGCQTETNSQVSPKAGQKNNISDVRRRSSSAAKTKAAKLSLGALV